MTSWVRKPVIFLMIGLVAVAFWLLSAPTEGRRPGSAEGSSPRPEPTRDALKAPLKNSKAALNKGRGRTEDVTAESPLRGWTQAKDPFTGAVRSYSGGNIELPGLDEKEKAENFIRQNARALFGVAPEDLVFEKASRAARLKITYQQTLSGYIVFGSTLALLFENGELQRVQNDLKSEPRLPDKSDWRFEEVFETYRLHPNGGLRSQGFVQTVELVKDPALGPRLVLYPASRGLIFVYQFYVDEVSRGGSPGRAMVLYDPIDARVVRKTNLRIQ